MPRIEVQQLIACSSLPTVSVECNYLNLRVVAKRALFYPDELVGLDELFLGTGCRVTYVRPDEFEFNIPIQYCGIVIEVREGTVLPAAICKVCSSVTSRSCLTMCVALVLPAWCLSHLLFILGCLSLTVIFCIAVFGTEHLNPK